MSVENLQKLLEAHIQPVNFVAAEREKFHNLRQRADESARSFLLRIQQQAAKCDFAGTLEEQMRDRIVAGVADQDLKRKLLRRLVLRFNLRRRLSGLERRQLSTSNTWRGVVSSQGQPRRSFLEQDACPRTAAATANNWTLRLVRRPSPQAFVQISTG